MNSLNFLRDASLMVINALNLFEHASLSFINAQFVPFYLDDRCFLFQSLARFPVHCNFLLHRTFML
jgi:hypothetical protein